MRPRCWLLLLALVTLFSCSPGPPRLRVALDPHHPPLAFLDEKEKPAGFEVDLARALGQSLHREVEIVAVPTQGLVRDVNWGGIFAGLTGGSYDLVVSSVLTTADRKREWGLSEPYLAVGPILVVRRDRSSDPLASWKAGTLGVVAGTQGREAVVRTPATRDWSRVYYDLESALEDLADGRIDGVVADVVDVAAQRLENEKFALNLKTVGAVLESDVSRSNVAVLTYSAVVAPGNEGLLAQVNGALAAFEADGTLAQLKKRWFIGP